MRPLLRAVRRRRIALRLRRLFLDGLAALHRASSLPFFGARAGLADPSAFAAHLAPPCRADWVVYAKLPFGGPEQVLAYLSRYSCRRAGPRGRNWRFRARGCAL